MIRIILKWTGLLLLATIVLLVLGYFYIVHTMNQRVEKAYAFTATPVPISTDSSALNRGKHLVVIKGCVECHGENLGGKLIEDSPEVGRLVASNLTKGVGGLSSYTTADWVRALRHGIDPTGKPLRIMPSHETAVLSAADLGAIIAYCQQLAPVNNALPETSLGPIAKLLGYFDKIPLLPVEQINHETPLMAQTDTTESVALGQYLSVACSGCHRPSLKGGEPFVPGQLPSPDLTRTGRVGKWTKEQFMTTLQTGKTPDGHPIKNEDMPWKMTAQYSRTELGSLYLYLQSLP